MFSFLHCWLLCLQIYMTLLYKNGYISIQMVLYIFIFNIYLFFVRRFIIRFPCRMGAWKFQFSIFYSSSCHSLGKEIEILWNEVGDFTSDENYLNTIGDIKFIYWEYTIFCNLHNSIKIHLNMTRVFFFRHMHLFIFIINTVFTIEDKLTILHLLCYSISYPREKQVYILLQK